MDEHDIETANDVIVKSSVNKSKTKILIIQQVDRKVDLEEIAETVKLSGVTLVTVWISKARPREPEIDTCTSPVPPRSDA